MGVEAPADPPPLRLCRGPRPFAPLPPPAPGSPPLRLSLLGLISPACLFRHHFLLTPAWLLFLGTPGRTRTSRAAGHPRDPGEWSYLPPKPEGHPWALTVGQTLRGDWK